MPASSASWSVSSSTTSRPAFAHAIAMPPPIVPAPMMRDAMRPVGGVDVGRHRRDLGRPPARRRRRGSAPWPARTHALEEQLPLAAAASRERQRAWRLRWPRRPSAAPVWCGLIFAASRACRREQRRVDCSACRACRVRSLVFGCGPPRRTARRERHRAVEEIAVDHRVDQAGVQRLGCADRLAVTHMSSAFSTPASRGSRCVPSAPGNDAELHLGLTELRVGRRDPIVPRHRQLEAASQRGAVYRHDDRLL